MKPRYPAIAVLALLIATLLVPADGHAQSAQTSVRAPTDVSGVRMGLVCDIANGWAMSTTANGTPTCTQSVTNATNATNAVNATTATTATQAQTLNPAATVNANQISGVIAAGNLPAGTGGGGTATLAGCTHPGTGAYYANGGSYSGCTGYHADSGQCLGTFTSTCNNGTWQ